jgi:UDP-xylose:glucoside alpha-1,3-xylosyltransferase
MNSKQMLGLIREPYSKDFGWFHEGSPGQKSYKRSPYIRPVPFSSGVLLMNLTRLRKSNWLTEMIKNYEYYMPLDLSKLGDESLINIYINKSLDSFLEIPCHWNYQDEHCSFEKDLCDSANEKGIGLYHHHGLSQFKEAASYIVYYIFKKFSLNNSIENLIEMIDVNIQIKSVCKDIHNNFIIGMKRFLHNGQ